ncbi:programmed cell death protein 7 [Halichoeres trimaculatus]|uniref:programmed cell death protein 7 n=1 Tax=Halichoeres trimaculatus TaxID=147232 RepID=UPI003D9E174E
MDKTWQPPDYYIGYNETPYTAERPPYPATAQASAQPDPAAPQWTPSAGYDSGMYGFGYDVSALPLGGEGPWCGGPRFPPPFGFDPSVPPPPLGFSPPGLAPRMEPPAPMNTSHCGSRFHTRPFRPGCQNVRYDSDSGQSPVLSLRVHDPDRDQVIPRAEDHASLQRTQDQQWITGFLQSRGKSYRSTQSQRTQTVSELKSQQPQSVLELRRALSRAAMLVSQLTQTCESLRSSMEDSKWTRSHSAALEVKEELRDLLLVLGDSQCLARWKAQLNRIKERRSRRRRSRMMLRLEEQQREELSVEKEASIDRWRLQQIQQVEEKKKEQEVKRAADSVLCEVRRKQIDVKRMQDVLRSVEKLRKLRKEAASRKGIVTEPECDQVFMERVEQLRSVMKRRTAVYCAEEKALRVMLEGEQEEERRREQERRGRKERERQLQRRNRAHTMLFGDELPADHVLQPFRQFHTQAERSLLALLHIRREWDMFMVEEDHPDGSPVPQTWIIPDPPSDQVWASALQTVDTGADTLCV